MKLVVSVIFSLFIFVFELAGQTYTTVSTFAGSTTAGLVNGTLTAARFDFNYGICSDSAGNLYVADCDNHCIRKISGGIVTTVAGNGTSGDVDAQGSSARFRNPTGVYFKNGYLYICDNFNNKIKRMDMSFNVVTIAGSGTPGFLDGAALTARFFEPKSIVVDDSNHVFVADYENHRIRKIANGMVTTYAGGSAGDVLGPAATARFNRPRDLCIDATGNLYVADLINNKIKVISPTGIVSLIAGSGSTSSVDGTGPAASFSRPVGIDWGMTGDLFVLDSWTGKIRRVTLSGVTVTIAGSGVNGYINGPVGTARFGQYPQDICFDPAWNLYVGDRTNNVVRILTNTPVIVASANVTNVTCNGNADGTAIVTPSGGTGSYTYLWSPIGGTDSTATGLPSGTYTCTITDSVGNVLQQTVTISQPAAVAASITSTMVGCISSNGSATVSASGGTGPFTYSWSPSGGTNAVATGLATGSYTCTITDANGCTGTASTTITSSPLPLITLASQGNIACFGGNTGTATVSVSSGTGPFTYAWSPSGGTAQTGTGLSAGGYTCTVTDAQGCTATQSVNITEPNPLISTISSDTATCGNPNGTAAVNASGGTGPYTYLWSNSQTTPAISNLAGGTYSVTITDANGCTTDTDIVVVAISAQVVSVQSVGNLLCFGGTNGSASVNVTGGTAPFVYSWAPSGGANSVATGLNAGTYTVTVIGNDGCIQTQLVTLTQPNALSVVDNSTAENCSNTDGSASVSVVGGTPGYTYLWSNLSVNDTITNVSSGSYTVTVTDMNGCSTSTTVAVGNVNSAIADAGISVTISEGQSTVLNGSGGNAYNWSPNTGLSCTACQDPVASPLVTTTYTLVVVDANGCTAVDSVTVSVETLCGEIFLPNAFSPNNDSQNDVFYVRGKCIVTMDLRIYNRWGENVFSSTDITKGWDGTWRGNLCEPAVFTYVLSAVLSDGTEVVKNGNISLVK